jgi:hypothetical protein
MFFITRNHKQVTCLTSREKAIRTYNIANQAGLGLNDIWQLCNQHGIVIETLN